MKIRAYLITCYFLMCAYLNANTVVNTYFPESNYEFSVYLINGKEPGPTLMVIGAIQGDEVAPYLVADSFADIQLKKGNLILVPRANLPTVMEKRRLMNYDMNRRFDTQQNTVYEDQVVEILKKYIMQSNYLLNLHEGGGFYRHSFEGPEHNPMKYGQCLIADADIYTVPNTGKTINLKQIAEDVIAEINKQIKTNEHKYLFNNHNTLAQDTKHVEQRKSATFFALTKANIPAYGVEVSRALPNEAIKMEYLRIIINEFMNYIGLQMFNPVANDSDPMLHHILVRVNNEKRYFEPNDVIMIEENSKFQITGITSNHKRGNFADIVGYGNKNDLNKSFNINRNTEIIVYKDYHVIGKIPIRITSSSAVAFEGFRVNVIDDNSFKNVFAADTLVVTDGAEFEILGAINNNPNINVNISGATPIIKNGRKIIDTMNGIDNRFAINTDKNLYDIIILENNRKIADAFLRLKPIESYGLQISHNGKQITMAPGDTLFAKYGDILFIHDVLLSGLQSHKVKVNFAGFVLDPKKDAEDRGGNIHLTRSNLLSSFAVNSAKNVYEIHILYKTKKYGVYRVMVN